VRQEEVNKWIVVGLEKNKKKMAIREKLNVGSKPGESCFFVEINYKTKILYWARGFQCRPIFDIQASFV